MSRIDKDHFEEAYGAFVGFVERESRQRFRSFSENHYTAEQEGYKESVHRRGRKLLMLRGWTRESAGDGRIARCVVDAIEQRENNLVQWQPKHGQKATPHRQLMDVLSPGVDATDLESSLFDLMFKESIESAFEQLTRIVGKQFGLLAYLCFLRDRGRYLPLAPSRFEEAFEMLGVTIALARQCSWQRYDDFNALVGDVRAMLQDHLPSQVTLLDAHSFLWILSNQMRQSESVGWPSATDVLGVDYESIRMARRGQGVFRDRLIRYWGGCAVTGVADERLLVASHIRPWRNSSAEQRLDEFNGLLLTPTLDRLFDGGLVSFTSEGRILMSRALAKRDRERLGVSDSLSLRRADPRHEPYLDYHRDVVWNSE